MHMICSDFMLATATLIVRRVCKVSRSDRDIVTIYSQQPCTPQCVLVHNTASIPSSLKVYCMLHIYYTTYTVHSSTCTVVLVVALPLCNTVFVQSKQVSILKCTLVGKNMTS